jgi:hypothetical protein
VYILKASSTIGMFYPGFGGRMTKVETNPGLASRAVAFGALTVAATAIGLLAIGWITIRRLRPF